jgi:hypothetical protein
MLVLYTRKYLDSRTTLQAQNTCIRCWLSRIKFCSTGCLLCGVNSSAVTSSLPLLTASVRQLTSSNSSKTTIVPDRGQSLTTRFFSKTVQNLSGPHHQKVMTERLISSRMAAKSQENMCLQTTQKNILWPSWYKIVTIRIVIIIHTRCLEHGMKYYRLLYHHFIATLWGCFNSPQVDGKVEDGARSRQEHMWLEIEYCLHGKIAGNSSLK